MLQTMRDKFMGVLGWVVIGLIIMTFALFGLGSYLQDDARAYAARVNDIEISPRELQIAYQQQRARLEQAMGDAYSPDLINDQLIRQRALDGLIRRQLILQAAEADGFKVSDQLLAANIQGISALQVDGRFSEESYKQALFRLGQTVAGFEYETRRQLTAEQLINGLTATAIVTDTEINDAYLLQEQKRDFAYLTVSAAPFEVTAEPDDEQIKQYYESRTDAFMVPEKVKLEYIRLTSEDLGGAIEIDESRLQAYYDEKKEALRKQEQRRASHILIQVAADADEETQAEAGKKAEDLLSRIKSGEDFSALASENSDDPGSAKQGGDLGFFGEGAMVPEFDEAVFTMNPGDTPVIVRSQFGYHIIKLVEVQGSETPEFEEVKARLTEELQQQAADEQFYELLDQLTDTSYENPESLDAAADALSLEIRTTDWLDASGGGDIGQYPKVLAAAFSEDVLEAGNNSEPVEVANSDVIVLRVLEHEPASQSPLENVRDQVVDILKAQQARQEAKSIGQSLLEKVRSGESLEALNDQDYLSWEVVEAGKRSEADNNPEVVREAFKLERPDEGQTVEAGVELGNGDYVVLQVTRVLDADVTAMAESVRKQMKTGFEQLRRSVDLATMVENLRMNADIQIPSDEE